MCNYIRHYVHGANASKYKTLFRSHLDSDIVDDIRAACQTGTPLGDDLFRQKIEAKLKCKVGQARRGRPRKLELEDVD